MTGSPKKCSRFPPGPPLSHHPWPRRPYHRWLRGFILFSIILMAVPLHAKDTRLLTGNGIRVLFKEPLEPVAQELVRIYPEVRKELETTFGWDLSLTPTILITRDTHQFRHWADSPLTVAFAVPEKDWVVIDNSRMTSHPFSLGDTFKHELCHLLLHYHIQSTPLPCWLDEGVAQWASDGARDIVLGKKHAILNRTAMSGHFIPLASLSRDFPRSDDQLILAYEESKSFVDYLIGTSGKAGLRNLLDRMKQGQSVEEAVLETYGESLRDLERKWHRDLRTRMTWFTQLSYHLYEILFALAALATIFGAIRVLMKKRRRMREYADDPVS